MPTSTRLALCIAFAVAVVLLGACSKSVGDSCKAGDVSCADKASGLFCANGKLAVMSCNGPLGCTSNGSNDVTCDNSFASVGDGCNEDSDAACSLDKSAALECKNGKFVLAGPCKGQKRCQLRDNKIFCDNNTSDPGDLCHEDGDYACSTDQRMLLQCMENRFQEINSCRGPKACSIHEHPEEAKIGFDCDDSVAEVNDPCDANGEESCGMDRRSLQICKNSRFAFVKNCHGSLGCLHDERTDRFTCDTHGR